eukprot:m.107762 g.107762  ORF g.107762 m.107762 type:complete len:1248 (-) comp12772_c0_seq8:122-3865(-)
MGWSTTRECAKFLLMPTAVLSCVFDCHDPAPCGGEVEFVNASLVDGEWNAVDGKIRKPEDYEDDIHPYYGDELEYATSAAVIALDLRGRGIKGIAPKGLECYNMDGSAPSFNGTVAQAILLDNNDIAEMPDMTVFNGCPIVSMSNNDVPQMPKSAFANFSGDQLDFYCVNCGIKSLAVGMIDGTSELSALNIYLQNNSISALENGTFATKNVAELKIYLDHNQIDSLGAFVFSGFAGSFAAFYMQYNAIEKLDSNMLMEFEGSNLYLFAENNKLTSIPLGMFSNVNTGQLLLQFSHNSVTELPPLVFDNYLGAELQVYLEDQNPPMKSLPTQLLAGYWGTELSLSVQNNEIDELGRLFYNCSFAGQFDLYLANNKIDETDLATAMGSWIFQLPPTVHLNAENNLIGALPPKLFANCSVGAAFTVASSLELLLSRNPITFLSPSVFQTNPAPGGLGKAMFTTRLTIDVSSPITPIEFPEVFSFSGPLLASAASTLRLNASNTSACHCIVDAFNGFTGELLEVDLSFNAINNLTSSVGRPNELRLKLNMSYNQLTVATNLAEVAGLIDLSNNLITMTAEGAFGRGLKSLNLSNNRLTYLDPQTFNYTFQLRELLLTNNNLTLMHCDFFDNTPGLTTLHIENNQIRAIPMTQNKLANPATAAGNPLICSTYGPLAGGCSCPPGEVLSQHCDYQRCTQTVGGCPSSEIANASDCSIEPFSVCISGMVPGFFYNTATDAFQPLTVCQTRFVRDGVHLPAYEFAPPSATSDRLCGICSVCPSGFHKQPCTATTDTRCTKELGPGDIASISISIFLLALIGLVGWRSANRQRRQRVVVATELEMTAGQLRTVTKEKDQIREEKDRMSEAWKISVDDIVLNTKVAEGSYGAVWRGLWGTQHAAIKVLKRTIGNGMSNSIDSDVEADFKAECSTLQSIRHPNLLIFYGAGITEYGAAFIVTEWMEIGSLRRVLSDSQRSLDFDRRAVIAVQIAKGVHHLHKLKIVHRDLKSDNVLLDANMTAKIADFGTSKLLTGSKPLRMRRESHESLTVDPTGSMDAAGGMTRGVGTTVWMAPEIFLGQTEYGPAIDAYSFGIIMWELATRQWPWEELNSDSFINLFSKLDAALRKGLRPTIPPAFAAEHPAYTKTMVACWATNPEERPNFDAVVFSLGTICNIGADTQNSPLARMSSLVPDGCFDDDRDAWRDSTEESLREGSCADSKGSSNTAHLTNLSEIGAFHATPGQQARHMYEDDTMW